MQYNQELKNSILKRMLPPSNESAAKISREKGISTPTLHKRKKAAISSDYAIPTSRNTKNKWTTEDKFQIVVETARMNEILPLGG